MSSFTKILQFTNEKAKIERATVNSDGNVDIKVDCYYSAERYFKGTLKQLKAKLKEEISKAEGIISIYKESITALESVESSSEYKELVKTPAVTKKKAKPKKK